MRKDSAAIMLVSAIFASVVFGSFFIWWNEAGTRTSPVSTAFVVFAWSLVLSNVFLLITRAAAEYRGRRR